LPLCSFGRLLDFPFLTVPRETDYYSNMSRPEGMAVLFAATFLLRVQRLAGCECCSPRPLCFVRFLSCINVLSSRFAFVEYESRRDADDAYHEMHNKRIGRDDLLKIEVSN
jgi:hypothetical protein